MNKSTMNDPVGGRSELSFLISEVLMDSIGERELSYIRYNTVARSDQGCNELFSFAIKFKECFEFLKGHEKRKARYDFFVVG